MNFPRSPQDTAPADLTLTRTNTDESLTTQTIKTTSNYKYLGVTLDPKLHWSTHHQKVIANATWWSHQVARLSKTSSGMPPKRVHQLYNTVAVPTFSYAADVWYTNIHLAPSGRKRLGLVSITWKLSSIQRKVAKIITGSLATTAGDTLEAHSNLLPIDLLFNKILYRIATCITSLHNTHPLHPLAHKAANVSSRNTAHHFITFFSPPKSIRHLLKLSTQPDTDPATPHHSAQQHSATNKKP